MNIKWYPFACVLLAHTSVITGWVFSICFSVHSGRIFITSTCDLFVAETSASTSTAILEQDVNFAAQTNTHGINSSQQNPGNLRCLVWVTNKSDLESDLTPSPSSSSSSSYLPTSPLVFKMSKVTCWMGIKLVLLLWRPLSVIAATTSDPVAGFKHWVAWRLFSAMDRTKAILKENKPFLFKGVSFGLLLSLNWNLSSNTMAT